MGPLEPRLHVQSLCALLPTGELELAGQLPHVLEDVAPEVVEYLPLTQLVHTVTAVASEYLPAAQFTHDPLDRY